MSKRTSVNSTRVPVEGAECGFNVTQGMLSACIGIGNGLSNLLAGFVAQKAGYNVGFLTLTAIALGALAFFWFFVPETKEQKA